MLLRQKDPHVSSFFHLAGEGISIGNQPASPVKNS
jgi:hypothetical protein